MICGVNFKMKRNRDDDMMIYQRQNWLLQRWVLFRSPCPHLHCRCVNNSNGTTGLCVCVRVCAITFANLWNSACGTIDSVLKWFQWSIDSVIFVRLVECESNIGTTRWLNCSHCETSIHALRLEMKEDRDKKKIKNKKTNNMAFGCL